MTISADAVQILTDALAYGLADAATYTPAATGTPVAVTIACQDIPVDNIEDVGGEVYRRDILVLMPSTGLAGPVMRSDTLTVAAGDYTGTWRVTKPGTSDAGVVVFTARYDTRVKARAAGRERMPS